MSAEYELEHLLLEGHCFDLSTGQPPRGLQFTLGMSQDPLMHDTIVMANLVSPPTPHGPQTHRLIGFGDDSPQPASHLIALLIRIK